MLLYTRLAPPKVPKKRSRAGCIHCKEKKKKCDEERPQCARCAERGLGCTYEAVKPRQRRKRDSVASPGHSSDTSHLSNIPYQRPGRKLSEDSAASLQDGSVEEIEDVDDGQFSPTVNGFSDAGLVSPLDGKFEYVPFVPAADVVPVLGTQDMSGLTSVDAANDTERKECGARTERSTLCHRFIESRLPEDHASGMLVPHRSSTSLRPDLAKIATSPLGSPLLDFSVPAFSEFSNRPNRRALVDHFCNVLSHLIVFREETGNPFQQLVLPLAHQSSAVMNALFALASAHLEHRGVNNFENSLSFHNHAIQGLARLIENDGKVNRNEVLATIMLLVYYEVLVQRGRSNIVDGHLKGALTIMSSNPESNDPTAIFLERAFRFYDVITALSFGTAPLSTAPAAGCLLPFPPMGARAASPMSNVDTLLGMATTLWPIIHRLSNLRSFKAELGRALRTNQSATKIAVLRTELQTTAEAIERALQQWAPCLPPHCTLYDDSYTKVDVAVNGDGEDAKAEKARIHSILNNALAYRHSALVYLYRIIYSYSRSHPQVQTHVHQALAHCYATVSHAGPMGALLWPLFVSACEAVSSEDRELTERTFTAIDKRQGMMNIERAWSIVREVWRRADLVKEEDAQEAFIVGLPSGSGNGGGDLWRIVSHDMGVNIVFG